MSDQKPENWVQTSLQIAAGIVEKVPIYDDLVKPSAQQIGQGLGNLLKAFMFPMTILGYNIDAHLAKFQKSLDEKTAKIPLEKLQAPNPAVMGPIIQALGYTVHEDGLREMFTSLLATAMNSETAYTAHPSFVEIIKQLNSDEAKILTLLRDGKNRPVVEIHAYEKGLDSYIVVTKNESFVPEDANCTNIDLGPQYIDNLSRLGLVEVPTYALLASDEEYQRLNEWFSAQNSKRENKDTFEWKLEKRLIRLTAFGKQFIKACVLEPTEQNGNANFSVRMEMDGGTF